MIFQNPWNGAESIYVVFNRGIVTSRAFIISTMNHFCKL